jgi:hypothetical protein
VAVGTCVSADKTSLCWCCCLVPKAIGHALLCVQAALLDSMYGTERGLAARSEIRAEINELITQLEAKNPVPSPTDVSECTCSVLGLQPGGAFVAAN